VSRQFTAAFVNAAIAWLLAELAMPALATPAPDIDGKSVWWSWTEARQQRTAGASEAHSATIEFDLRIYVSSAGRSFTRLSSAARRGSASNEQVGDNGASLADGVRSVRVDAHSIVLQAIFGNYARNLGVDAAAGGGSCSAQMSVGKKVGSAPKAFRNGSGMIVEIQSLTVSGVTCSVQNGNVFAR
jgi:hypothetical protein